MSNHPDPTDYSFTYADDTGRRRLNEAQRLMLHILMETEPYVETSPAGADVLSALDASQEVEAPPPPPAVAEPARPREVRDAAKGELAGCVLGGEEVTA